MMKTRRTLAIVVAAAVGMAAAVAAQNALSQAGVNEAAAREAVLRAASGGYVDYSLASKALKALGGAARAQLTTALIAWARTYAATPAFQKAYATQREDAKPSPPAFEGTPEEELEKQKAEANKSVEEMKKAMAAMSPEQRKYMEEALKASAAAMAQLDTPEMRKMQLDGLRMERDAATTQYKADLQRWEKDYPAAPGALIARRLQEFLDISATVDFDAKLESRDGTMRFANPAYESKDTYWKLCYRAGRETVDTARAAAQTWLKELQAR